MCIGKKEMWQRKTFILGCMLQKNVINRDVSKILMNYTMARTNHVLQAGFSNIWHLFVAQSVGAFQTLMYISIT